jgi:hypothetical protein
MIDIKAQHHDLVEALIGCTPGTERARELRVMVFRLEMIEPDLERQRIEAMCQKLIGYQTHLIGRLHDNQ